MKTRIMLGALIMAAVIGSSVGVGYAGSDGGGTGSAANLTFYQCYGIDKGAKPPRSNYVLSWDDQFTNSQPNGVSEQVGKLKLVCPPPTFSSTTPSASPDTLETSPQFDGADHLTCYEIPVTQAYANSVVTLQDAFGEQTVTVLGPAKYVCVLAKCVSGVCP